jgi:hypothetical protein
MREIVQRISINLHSRLLQQNMLNQAELKSHIRNEHLRNNAKKEKIRDRFNAQKEQSDRISITRSSNSIIQSHPFLTIYFQHSSFIQHL